MIDLDGDNIPEGWDYNSDGQLDICHHGLVNQSQKPSNANCVRSEGAGSTPFFIPICEALRDAIHETEDYREFIFANNFEEIYSNTWLNRTLSASASVERFESTLSRFKLMEYDPALFALGEFLKEFQKRIENLSADGRLHTNKRLAKDEDAGKALGRLRRNTTNVLAYMEEFQAKIGRCESPDTTTTSRIPPPVIEAEPPPPAQIPPGLEGSSCSASPENVQVGGTVVWTAYTSLTSPTYLWAGTGINSATTKSASTSYSSAGTQIASVTITGIDIEGEEKTGTILCANQVTVTGPTNPPGGEDGGPGDEPL